VQRTGGLAGLRTTWRVEVDEQPDPDAWVVLIGELPWREVPPAPPEPDRYVYRIECAPHEALLAERQVTGPWRELVDRVRETSPPHREPPAAPRTR